VSANQHCCNCNPYKAGVPIPWLSLTIVETFKVLVTPFVSNAIAGAEIMRFMKKTGEGDDQAVSSTPQSLVNSIRGDQTEWQRRMSGSPTRALIDACLKINGDLETEGEVQVDGKINGNIRCAHLTVGRGATIIGDITADEVVVRGTVTGVIRGNRVILQDGAHVESEIFQNKLTIDEGACFKGMIRDQDESTSIDGKEEHIIALQEVAEKSNGGPPTESETPVKKSLAR
jgi:cytoskeletal protein CcmA (bactofilin family)